MRETDIEKLEDIREAILRLDMDAQQLSSKVLIEPFYDENGQVRYFYNFKDCIDLDVPMAIKRLWKRLDQNIERIKFSRVPTKLKLSVDPLAFKEIEDVRKGLKELLGAVEKFKYLVEDHILAICEMIPGEISNSEKGRLRKSVLWVKIDGKLQDIKKWPDVILLMGYLHDSGYIDEVTIDGPFLEKKLGLKAITKLNRYRGKKNPLFNSVILIQSKEGSQGEANLFSLNSAAEMDFAK